jgi:hypothetical protein
MSSIDLFGDSISAFTLYLILQCKSFSEYSNDPGKLLFNWKLKGKVYYPGGINLHNYCKLPLLKIINWYFVLVKLIFIVKMFCNLF